MTSMPYDNQEWRFDYNELISFNLNDIPHADVFDGLLEADGRKWVAR